MSDLEEMELMLTLSLTVDSVILMFLKDGESSTILKDGTVKVSKSDMETSTFKMDIHLKLLNLMDIKITKSLKDISSIPTTNLPTDTNVKPRTSLENS